MTEDIRKEALRYKEKNNISVQNFADRIGMERSTLSKFLGGTYESSTENIEKTVRAFLERESGELGGETGGKEVRRENVRPPEFFDSGDAVSVTAACGMAQRYTGVGIIVGKSGYGKTYALKKYAENLRVCYIECDDSMSSRDLVQAVEMSAGLPSVLCR